MVLLQNCMKIEMSFVRSDWIICCRAQRISATSFLKKLDDTSETQKWANNKHCKTIGWESAARTKM